MFTQKISALPNNADGSAVQEAESDDNGSKTDQYHACRSFSIPEKCIVPIGCRLNTLGSESRATLNMSIRRSQCPHRL